MFKADLFEMPAVSWRDALTKWLSGPQFRKLLDFALSPCSPPRFEKEDRGRPARWSPRNLRCYARPYLVH
jgi:hypothetical protein